MQLICLSQASQAVKSCLLKSVDVQCWWITGVIVDKRKWGTKLRPKLGGIGIRGATINGISDSG